MFNFGDVHQCYETSGGHGVRHRGNTRPRGHHNSSSAWWVVGAHNLLAASVSQRQIVDVSDRDIYILFYLP
jgi:hypothetical protein